MLVGHKDVQNEKKMAQQQNFTEVDEDKNQKLAVADLVDNSGGRAVSVSNANDPVVNIAEYGK